jgi:hypothetical protein
MLAIKLGAASVAYVLFMALSPFRGVRDLVCETVEDVLPERIGKMTLRVVAWHRAAR